MAPPLKGRKKMPKYKQVRVDGRTIGQHRAVWEKAHGPIPPGGVIHHINGDTLDNRLENLKLYADNSAHMKYGHHNVAENPDPRIVGQRLTELLGRASEIEALEREQQEINERLQAVRNSAGSTLRQARRDADLKLREVASALGTSASYVSQVENGIRGVSSETVMKFYNTISTTSSSAGTWTMANPIKEEEDGNEDSPEKEGNEGRST